MYTVCVVAIKEIFSYIFKFWAFPSRLCVALFRSFQKRYFLRNGAGQPTKYVNSHSEGYNFSRHSAGQSIWIKVTRGYLSFFSVIFWQPSCSCRPASVFCTTYLRYKINVKRREKALKSALENVSIIIRYVMQLCPRVISFSSTESTSDVWLTVHRNSVWIR